MKELDELIEELKEQIKDMRKDKESFPLSDTSHKALYSEIETIYNVVFYLDKIFGTNYYPIVRKE